MSRYDIGPDALARDFLAHQRLPQAFGMVVEADRSAGCKVCGQRVRRTKEANWILDMSATRKIKPARSHLSRQSPGVRCLNNDAPALRSGCAQSPDRHSWAAPSPGCDLPAEASAGYEERQH